MLQGRIADERGPEPAPTASSEGFTLTGLVPLARRYGLLVFSVTATCFLLALFYVLTAVPSYVASTQLLIESQKGQPFMMEPGLLDLTIDNAHVESQVEVLRSERISLAVIRQLGLTADPEFRGEIDPGTEADRIRPTIANFSERLGVRRLGQSYVLEVAFRSMVATKSARIANAVVEAYLQDQIDAKAQTARQGTEWLQARIEELSLQLRDSARAVQQFRAVRDGGGTVDTTAIIDAETRLIELESRVLSYRKLQENMLQKLTETAQKQSLAVTNARVITPATTPLSKSTPKTRLVLAMSILIGGLLGVGIAMLMHGNDHSIRNGLALRQATGLAAIGELPAFGVASERFRLTNRPGWRRNLAGKAPGLLDGVKDIASPFSDALRSTKVSIDVASLTKEIRCIGVTASAAGVGVSTIAASLAALYAAAGSRTLLIDGNVRDPSLTQAFGQRPRPLATVHFESSSRLKVTVPEPSSDGLITVLQRDVMTAPVETGLVIIPGTDVRLMPIGSSDGAYAGADLLGSGKMRLLLQSLRKAYAITIIDLPPLDRVADARAIAGSLDAVLIVAACGETTTAAIARVAEELESAHAAVIGVVINKMRSA
jgi:Mrp family chromosome partitioning ATPase/capsular polysaccharide biosynthesis protein